MNIETIKDLVDRARAAQTEIDQILQDSSVKTDAEKIEAIKEELDFFLVGEQGYVATLDAIHSIVCEND